MHGQCPVQCVGIIFQVRMTECAYRLLQLECFEIWYPKKVMQLANIVGMPQLVEIKIFSRSKSEEGIQARVSFLCSTAQQLCVQNGIKECRGRTASMWGS